MDDSQVHFGFFLHLHTLVLIDLTLVDRSPSWPGGCFEWLYRQNVTTG